MERIVVYHTAAIGDSVLATPVSVKLKTNFPEVKITYVTHESLIPLLSSCRAIDNFIAVDKQASFLDLRNAIQACKPDLIVDLSGSNKSMLNTAMLAKKILRYKKEENSKHAVENFLDTIAEICPQNPEEIFPTIIPDESEKEKIRKMVPKENRRLLALVPGVGALRPHRSWPEDNWVGLAKHILWEKDHALILIGGMDERTICSRIAEKVGEYCFNLSGKLSLRETAAALSICDATVSGDTGPAHLSVAVGTPVVGLYGPTLVERSGPYGFSQLALSASEKCKCIGRKSCSLAPGTSGDCMKNIYMKVVYGNLSSLFPWNQV